MIKEDLSKQIPYYLTQKAGEGLLRELENYSGKTQLFLSREIDGVLQGDGWRGFRVIDFSVGTVRSVRGIVLSNSCDIDPNNARGIPAKIIFAPLMKLSKLESVFLSGGVSAGSIKSKMDAIRAQKNTSFFYLPSQHPLDDEYVVWLNDVHSMPMIEFAESADRDRIFTLNMTGFYLFLFKLSIHFCRFHEDLDRTP